MSLIRRHGPRSRSELSRDLELRPNSVGELVGEMVDAGLLREGQAGALGPGRPRTPLEIDPSRRFVLGLAIQGDEASACRMNLLGQRIGDPLHRSIATGDDPAEVALALFDRLDAPAALGVGIAASGFIDADRRAIIASRLASTRRGIELAPLFDRAGDRPMILENDMHALAAQWTLTHGSTQGEDVLLVLMRDGTVGASVLIDGIPNRGCVLAGNELGHTRFFIDTAPCYCGHAGCLERIFSTDFLQRHHSRHDTLADACAAMDGEDPAMALLMDHVSAGLANAVNFFRPHRLVIDMPLARHGRFMHELQRRTVERLFAPIADRLHIERWTVREDTAAPEAAGWLALTQVYSERWHAPELPMRQPVGPRG